MAKACWTLVVACILVLGLSACQTAPPLRPNPPVPADIAPNGAPVDTGDAGRLTRCDPCTCPAAQDLGCWPCDPCRKTYVGAGLSFLPNVGFAFEAGHVFKKTPATQWSAEVQGVYQFLDDEDFIDDGNPGAGDWLQLRAGVKAALNPRARRHLTFRGGATWFQANGAPNIVDDPGDYVGGYVSVGFETDITRKVSVGPELSVAVATHVDGGGAVVVPQFTWRTTVWLGGGCCPAPGPQLQTAFGELYVGTLASVAPGYGGGIEVGQVISRSEKMILSMELMTAHQNLPDGLFAEGTGDWAQVRGGLKALFTPCRRGHWTARGGVAWLRSTGPTDFLDSPGDYIGGYVGLGYEWDLGRRFRTGPELALMVVTKENLDEGLEAVPQLNWHFIFKL